MLTIQLVAWLVAGAALSGAAKLRTNSFVLGTGTFFLWILAGIYLLCQWRVTNHSTTWFFILGGLWTAICLVRGYLPSKPWTIAMVTWIGEPTFVAKKKPGLKIVPPLYGLEEIIGENADLDYPHEKIMTYGDNARSHVPISAVVRADPDNLQVYQINGGIRRDKKTCEVLDLTHGIPGIFDNIISEELRSWGMSPVDGPQDVFELQGLQPEMNSVLLDGVVRKDLILAERYHKEGLLNDRLYEEAANHPVHNQDVSESAVIPEEVLEAASFGVLIRYFSGKAPSKLQCKLYGANSYRKAAPKNPDDEMESTVYKPVGDEWAKLEKILCKLGYDKDGKEEEKKDHRDLEERVRRREEWLSFLSSGSAEGNFRLYGFGVYLIQFNVKDIHQTGELEKAIENVGVEIVQRRSRRRDTITLKENIKRLTDAGLDANLAARIVTMKDGGNVSIDEQVVTINMDEDTAEAMKEGGAGLTALLGTYGVLRGQRRRGTPKKKGGSK